MIDLIEAALEARIQTLVGEQEIAWWGRPYAPTKGVPYLTVRCARNARPVGVGANSPELWQGTLQLLVVHPMIEGMAPARSRAVAVRNHFPRGLTLPAGSTTVCVESRTIDNPYSSADWTNVPVIVGWFTEENPA